jgi:hypothetical protein
MWSSHLPKMMLRYCMSKQSTPLQAESICRANLFNVLRLLYCQPAEDEGLKEHYSPATVAEVERWAAAVARPGNKEKLRKQHAEAAVAAIQFICRHEPDPGGSALCVHVCRAVRQCCVR